MDFEGAVARTLAHIEASPIIHLDNKQVIHDYHRDMILSHISAPQQQKLTSNYKVLAEHIAQTRFEDMEKEDLVDLVAWLYTRGTKESTITDYKQAIKQLWKWKNDGEDPEETVDPPIQERLHETTPSQSPHTPRQPTNDCRVPEQP